MSRFNRGSFGVAVLAPLTVLAWTTTAAAQPAPPQPQAQPAQPQSGDAPSLRRLLLDSLRVSPRATPSAAQPVVRAAPTQARKTGPKEVKVPLDLQSTKLEDLKVLARDAAGWKVAPESIGQGEAGAEVTVPTDRTVVVTPDLSKRTVPLTRLSADKSTFPGVMLKAKRGAAGATNVESFRLFLQAAYTPMRWDAEKRRYRAELLVGVDASDETATMDRPIQVVFAAVNAILEPPQTTIDGVGAAGYQRVALYSDEHEPPPRVTAYSDLGALAHELEVGSSVAAVDVFASAQRVLGFGLEGTTLTLSARAEDGLDLVPTTPMLVSISTTRGKLVAPHVTIPAGQNQANVDLQSSGFGDVEIVAAARGVKSDPLRVRFVFPWAFLTVILVAGALGGLVSYLRIRRRRGAGLLVLEGAIAGLVLVAAAVAGVSITGISTPLITTDVGRFALAAVGGFVGAPVFEMLKRLILRSDATSEARTAEPTSGGRG